MEQLRAEKERKEMESLTFHPKLISHGRSSKSMTGKVVITGGKPVVITPSRSERKREQRRVAERLMKYGKDVQVSREVMKQIKENITENMYEYKPQTCKKSE